MNMLITIKNTPSVVGLKWHVQCIRHLLEIYLFKRFGSCVLLTPAIGCQSILAIDTSMDPRSTSRSTLGRPSVDTRSTSQSTDFQFSLTLYQVAIDPSDDHTFDVGQHVDCYLAVGCR